MEQGWLSLLFLLSQVLWRYINGICCFFYLKFSGGFLKTKLSLESLGFLKTRLSLESLGFLKTRLSLESLGFLN
jgi:hypothetical protein